MFGISADYNNPICMFNAEWQRGSCFAALKLPYFRVLRIMEEFERNMREDYWVKRSAALEVGVGVRTPDNNKLFVLASLWTG